MFYQWYEKHRHSSVISISDTFDSWWKVSLPNISILIEQKVRDNSQILGLICLLRSPLCGFVSALISLLLLSGSSVRMGMAQYRVAHSNLRRFMRNANDSALRGQISWGRR